MLLWVVFMGNRKRNYRFIVPSHRSGWICVPWSMWPWRQFVPDLCPPQRRRSSLLSSSYAQTFLETNKQHVFLIFTDLLYLSFWLGDLWCDVSKDDCPDTKLPILNTLGSNKNVLMVNVLNNVIWISLLSHTKVALWGVWTYLWTALVWHRLSE